jgi:hypothetical protein
MSELSERFTSPAKALSAQRADEDKLERSLSQAVTHTFGIYKTMSMSRMLTSAVADGLWKNTVADALVLAGWSKDSDEFGYLESRLLEDNLGDEAYAVITEMERQASQTYPAPPKHVVEDLIAEALGIDEASLVAAGGFIDPFEKALSFGKQWRSRVKRNVRSSFTGMTGFVAMKAFQVARRETKTWVTRHDERVRSSHALLDGHTIPIHEKFHVGPSTMLYPGDRDAAVGETINCRCRIISRR